MKKGVLWPKNCNNKNENLLNGGGIRQTSLPLDPPLANFPCISSHPPRSPWGVCIKLQPHPWVYLLSLTVSIIYPYWTRILWVTHALCCVEWIYCSCRADRVSFDGKAAIVLVSIESRFWSVVRGCEAASWYHHCKRVNSSLSFRSPFFLYPVSIRGLFFLFYWTLWWMILSTCLQVDFI